MENLPKKKSKMKAKNLRDIQGFIKLFIKI